jgi:hypothetical protein
MLKEHIELGGEGGAASFDRVGGGRPSRKKSP